MYNIELIGERIKQVRKELDMTLEDVANKVGVAKSTIQRYEAGLIVSPKEPVLAAIANAFGINEEWIKGISSDKNVQTENNKNRIPIPVLGRVSAGMGLYADDDVNGYIFEDKDILNEDCDYVYLTVTGDSMYPEFKEGDMVFVECCPQVESGKFAVVMVDAEMGVIKRIIYGENFVELQSVNPMYPPRRFEGEDIQRVRIFGLVKGMKRSF